LPDRPQCYQGSVKFVHAADIHLDSPLRGLERYEGAPVERVRRATRDALENLVALCLEEQADLLLIAGDLYDGNWKDYGTGLYFVSQMARLRGRTRVVLIRGNHDAASQITRSLPLPDFVKELDPRRPESRIFEDLGVAVHGQSFASRAVTQDLAAGYPPALADLLNIGLLHTSVGGREGHENYAPCSLDTLRSKGYGYWALGHVHQREIVCDDPWVIFPGNLQGRHARETGAKGATLVTVEGGRVTAVEHRSLDVVRWCVCELDAGRAASPDDILDLVRVALDRAVLGADGRAVAARVVLAGRTPAHTSVQRDPEQILNAIRAVANDVGGGEVWVEKILVRTSIPVDLDEIAARDDAIGQLTRSLRALRTDDAGLKSLADDLADLRFQLPAEIREGDDAVEIDDLGFLRSVLDEVEQLLVPRLLAREEDR
jgi:DNA repair exonuclease SbcCD nuclease subunit